MKAHITRKRSIIVLGAVMLMLLIVGGGFIYAEKQTEEMKTKQQATASPNDTQVALPVDNRTKEQIAKDDLKEVQQNKPAENASDSKKADYYEQIALGQYYVGDYPAAETAYETMLKLGGSNNYGVHAEMARMYQKQNNTPKRDAAIKRAKQALSKSDVDSDTRAITLEEINAIAKG